MGGAGHTHMPPTCLPPPHVPPYLPPPPHTPPSPPPPPHPTRPPHLLPCLLFLAGLLLHRLFVAQPTLAFHTLRLHLGRRGGGGRHVRIERGRGAFRGIQGHSGACRGMHARVLSRMQGHEGACRGMQGGWEGKGQEMHRRERGQGFCEWPQITHFNCLQYFEN